MPVPQRVIRVCAAAFLVLIASVAPCAFAQQENPATTPISRAGEAWWIERHAAILKAAQAQPETPLLMIGDSITNNYDKANAPNENFQPTWKEFYEPRKALNLGFGGDTTGNVLWRLDHGEVDGLHPRVAVLLIGTNNTGHAHQTAEQTESGIDAVVGDIEDRLPETHIVLLGILPSGISAAKSQADAGIDAYLARCYGDDPRVTYLDIGSIFKKNGALDETLFYDPRSPHPGKALHPDTHGQRMMAEAIEPTIAKWMGDQPRVPLASMTDINTALIPVDRLEQDSYDWYARHHAELELQKTLKPRVVMLGDSITHFWAGLPTGNPVHGPMAWQQLFGNMPVINMGFGWDRTQNVLWRLRQGEFAGIAPEWVVLNIGTNNLAGTAHARASTPAEIVDAISEICSEIHQRSPQSRIVVMAIFPRGEHPSDQQREPIRQTNALLAQRFGSDPKVTYLDIGAQFLTADGTLPKTIMPDGTHPSEAGYQVWANALAKAGIRP